MSKESILLKSLTKFYEDKNNISILTSLLNKDNGVSLRNIEWFVTNHSRKNKTSYTADNGKQFVVHMAYKSSLDGYSKKLFDPFCRTQRIEFNNMTTTVAQLNFIKWCIENNIIDHVKDLKQKKSLPAHPRCEGDCTHSQTSAL